MMLKTKVCVASPQYAMPQYAMVMPTHPDTSSDTMPMIASSFCLMWRKRSARGTMLSEAMTKPKK